jgi:hypothetical protein
MVAVPASTLAELLPSADAEQATRHLEQLHRGCSGFVSFVLLRQPRQEAHSFAHMTKMVKTADHAHVQDSSDALAEVVRDRWNVYVACSTFAMQPDKGRGKREHIQSVPGVWADLDVKPGVEGYFQTEAEMCEFIARFPHRPTLEIASGSGGRHLYWLLDQPVDRDTGSKLLVGWLDLLREAANGNVIENVMDTTRILRLAGTVRWPKVDDFQSAEPRPVQLIKDNGPRFGVEEMYFMVEGATMRAEAERKIRAAERRRAMAEQKQRLGALAPESRIEMMINRFNRVVDWADLLERAGWTLFSDQRDGGARCRYWVRPGKNTGDGKSASTDYVNDDGEPSSTMTIYSLEPSLLPLWENGGTSDAHGICTKWHFAKVALFDGDDEALALDAGRKMRDGVL